MAEDLKFPKPVLDLSHPPGHGNRQYSPRFTPKQWKQIQVDPNTKDLTEKELQPQENLAKRHQRTKEAKEKREANKAKGEGQNLYTSLAIAPLILSFTSAHFELSKLFQSFTPFSKTSSTPWTLAGLGTSLLGITYLSRRYAEQIPCIGARAQFAFKMAGILGLGVAVFLSSRNQEVA